MTEVKVWAVKTKDGTVIVIPKLLELSPLAALIIEMVEKIQHDYDEKGVTSPYHAWQDKG